MSSLRNSVSRRAHKERAQPQSREKFGLLEKHKDYVVRAKAFHKKEDTLRRLKEKAAFRNPDEFNYKMMRSKTVDGVHIPQRQATKFTQEDHLLFKNVDMRDALRKIKDEKKKIEELTLMQCTFGKKLPNKHIIFVDSLKEARERNIKSTNDHIEPSISDDVQRKIMKNNEELEASKTRLIQLQESYYDMGIEKELKKKGRKRKLRQDELVNPTSKPVYIWRPRGKR